MKSHSGNDVLLIHKDFRYYFAGNLEEKHILDSLNSAIRMAKDLENIKSEDVRVSFNPNLLSLYLGHFDNEKVF
jgi:hypothetical protein|tara:strand:- start:3157 stop:3378 length:222 start_codon:yes stop_codon:yes gene_type:complete